MAREDRNRMDPAVTLSRRCGTPSRVSSTERERKKERERERERAICISTVHGCNRAAAAGIFLRGRELWRYDIGAYMRADKCVYRVLLLARDISSSPFRTVEPLF